MPKNPRWMAVTLHLLVAVTCASCFPERRPLEDQFVRADRELNQAKDEYERWLALTNYALVSVDHVANEQVRQSADEVLGVAPKYRRDWNYGNAIHKANLALGRVALRGGDTVAAKQYLKRAGETPGSPQLKSFGPNMTLAKELLERGEREAVIEYFKLCDRFWEMDWGKLDRWSKEIAAGKQPDFGANLLH